MTGGRKVGKEITLIIGGTGSLGQSIAKLLLERSGSEQRIVIFSRGEYRQHEMARHFSDHRLQFVIGDVSDIRSLDRVMEGVDLVVHAAALKQVTVAETNPEECIRVNVGGAINVVESAVRHRVRKVIAVSSDKAAKPINLYGATKLITEKLFTAKRSHATLFAAARYGNVVGSRGSVSEDFKHLAQQRSPFFPITDVSATRFWMTLPQAAAFVLSCFDWMTGGEIFVPKLPSMAISDLAKAVSETTPQRQIGLRPGEKLHEVLCPEELADHTLEFDDRFVILPSFLTGDEVSQYKNGCGSAGAIVPKGFEYRSLNNTRWVTVEEMKAMLRACPLLE